jgi:hypothetical protein
MQSTPTPKQPEDPHDVLEVAPGIVLVAPVDTAEDELSDLLRAAARQHLDAQTREEPNFSAGPPVPQVDATFRAAALGSVQSPGGRPPTGGRAVRGFTGFLLALCIGVAAAAWQAYGDAASEMIANFSPQRVFALLLPSQQPAPPAQPGPPAVEATAANAAVTQPAAAPPATSSEAGPSPQSMARDLAAAQQEIAELKASIEQLKASQEQMSSDIAKVSEIKASEAKPSEQNPRPRISAPIAAPARSAAVPARKPVPSFRRSQAAAPYPPPAAAAYPPPAAAAYPPYPRSVEPPPMAAPPPPPDPELASVPRPPMPVR